jgi:TetR/AcrR family transcriptional regulator, transcriptional repressor for nem operon
MLAAQHETLPPVIRAAVIAFLDENEAWLEPVLEQGRNEGRFTFEGPAREVALSIVAGLEGAMLVARPHNEVERFETTAARLLASLSGHCP